MDAGLPSKVGDSSSSLLPPLVSAFHGSITLGTVNAKLVRQLPLADNILNNVALVQFAKYVPSIPTASTLSSPFFSPRISLELVALCIITKSSCFPRCICFVLLPLYSLSSPFALGSGCRSNNLRVTDSSIRWRVRDAVSFEARFI